LETTNENDSSSQNDVHSEINDSISDTELDTSDEDILVFVPDPEPPPPPPRQPPPPQPPERPIPMPRRSLRTRRQPEWLQSGDYVLSQQTPNANDNSEWQEKMEVLRFLVPYLPK
jgi:hypothetical protein